MEFRLLIERIFQSQSYCDTSWFLCNRQIEILLDLHFDFHCSPLVYYVNRMHSAKMKKVQITKYVSIYLAVSECVCVCGAENSRSH